MDKTFRDVDNAANVVLVLVLTEPSLTGLTFDLSVLNGNESSSNMDSHLNN